VNIRSVGANSLAQLLGRYAHIDSRRTQGRDKSPCREFASRVGSRGTFEIAGFVRIGVVPAKITRNGAGFTNRVQRARREGFGNSFKVQDYAKRDTRRGAEVKLSAPTSGADDRTDDCACGADDVAVPATVQISTFSNDR
jgi:hypothetical protein